MQLTIFILYGESKRDAERALALSQQLQINESKPVGGIGEQAYELAKEGGSPGSRFAKLACMRK